MRADQVEPAGSSLRSRAANHDGEPNCAHAARTRRSSDRSDTTRPTRWGVGTGVAECCQLTLPRGGDTVGLPARADRRARTPPTTATGCVLEVASTARQPRHQVDGGDRTTHREPAPEGDDQFADLESTRPDPELERRRSQRSSAVLNAISRPLSMRLRTACSLMGRPAGAWQGVAQLPDGVDRPDAGRVPVGAWQHLFDGARKRVRVADLLESPHAGRVARRRTPPRARPPDAADATPRCSRSRPPPRTPVAQRSARVTSSVGQRAPAARRAP